MLEVSASTFLRSTANSNTVGKFHCTYCEYGNGLMSYMAEILARIKTRSDA